MTKAQPRGDPYDRAMAAYWRSRLPHGSPMQPHDGFSGTEQYQGREYVVLANSSHTLAVYRVKNNGLLRELRRWPKAIDPHTQE